MIDQEQLRNHLKKEVASRKLSLRELGRLSGIDHATLSKIMNGKREMNFNHMRRLLMEDTGLLKNPKINC